MGFQKEMEKKKTGFVLWLPVATCPPIWLGHFSDLGSVNITQKKKKAASLPFMQKQKGLSRDSKPTQHPSSLQRSS